MDKKIVVIKVGNADRPANERDLKDATKEWKKFARNKRSHLVTHHAFEIEELVLGKGESLIYKVGNADRPATDKDIKSMQKAVDKAFKTKKKSYTIVTHHALQVEKIKK